MASDRTALIGIVCLPWLLTSTAPMAAETVVAVDRYNREVATPSSQQWNILDVVVSLNFPESIATVGDAVEYALRQSGYLVAPNALQDRSATVLFSLPLPGIHRQISNVTLLNFLKMVAGPAYTLVIDQRTRTITYEASRAFPVEVAVVSAKPVPLTTVDVTGAKPSAYPAVSTAKVESSNIAPPIASEFDAPAVSGPAASADASSIIVPVSPDVTPPMVIDPLANIED